MSLIKPLMNRTLGAKELFFVGFYSIMTPGAASYFLCDMDRFVSNDVMISVSIIIMNKNNLWGVKRGGQSTNGVSIGNRSGSGVYQDILFDLKLL